MGRKGATLRGCIAWYATKTSFSPRMENYTQKASQLPQVLQGSSRGWWHVAQAYWWHHYTTWKRDIPMETSQESIHREEKWQIKATRIAKLEWQTTSGSHTDGARSLLRATIFKIFSWIQTWARLPHRVRRNTPKMERCKMVHRRRHQRVFRQY